MYNSRSEWPRAAPLKGKSAMRYQTQPMDLEEKVRVLWAQMREMADASDLQTRQIELLERAREIDRRRIERLEQKVKGLESTQPLR
jgi:hypothetical protein